MTSRCNEQGFGAHDMDAAVGIDELSDVDVTGNRNKRVGVIASDVGVVGILF